MCAPPHTPLLSLAYIIDEILVKGRIHYSWGCGQARYIGSEMQCRLENLGGRKLQARERRDERYVSGWVGKWAGWTSEAETLLQRGFSLHTGTYLTHEAKGSDDAPDADTAIINAEGGQSGGDDKKEYFI